MDELSAFLVGLSFGCLITLTVIVIAAAGSTYKDGQIDALNGKIYYSLELQEDNSLQWKYCGGLCEK